MADQNIETTITECKIMLEVLVKDLAELKQETVTKEAYNNLLERVVKLEGVLWKAIGLMGTAIGGAILTLVIK